MTERTIALLRVNPRLTSNVKIMCSDNELYLESIDARLELRQSRLKAYSFRGTDYFPDILSEYWSGISNDIAYYTQSNDTTILEEIRDYGDQWSTLLWYGARPLVSNNYDQEYEYLAPLKVIGDTRPQSFIVFRVDGTGQNRLVKENFKSLVLNQLKVVKQFDIHSQSALGKLLDNNHLTPEWPEWSLYWTWSQVDSSRLTGIDLAKGGITDFPFYTGEWSRTERRPFEMDEMVTQQYQELGCIEPNLLNLSWMFDDTPRNRESKLDFTISRYYGFYIDETNPLDQSLTFYHNPDFNPALTLNSVVISSSGLIELNANQDLFEEQLPVNSSYDYWYLNKWYVIKRVSQTTWQVSGEDDALFGLDLQQVYDGSKKLEVTWRQNSLIGGKTELVSRVEAPYSDGSGLNSTVKPAFDDLIDTHDVVLQNIDGVLTSVIVKLEYNPDSGDVTSVREGFFINLDGDLTYDEDQVNQRLIHLVGGENLTLLQGPDYVMWPELNFEGCAFTEVHDYDFERLDTNYSRFEYEVQTNTNNTEEPRSTEISTNNSGMLSQRPPRVENFAKIGARDYATENGLLPLSSEYSMSQELWELRQNEGVSEIWNPNQTVVKWGYDKSSSHATVPYPLSNSVFINERYNKGVNITNQRPVRAQRNLDWFLTSLPDNDAGWIWHSLHLDHGMSKGMSNDFSSFTQGEWEYYYDILKAVDTDWFDVIWGRTEITGLNNIYRNPQWSGFHSDGGDRQQWTSSWRGIGFRVGLVDRVTQNDEGRYIFSLQQDSDFSQWRMSCLAVIRTIDPSTVADNQFLLDDGTPIPWTLSYSSTSGTEVKSGVSITLRIIVNERWKTITPVLVLTMLDETRRSLGVQRDLLYKPQDLYRVLSGHGNDLYVTPYPEYCQRLLVNTSDASTPQNVLGQLSSNDSIFDPQRNLLQPDMLSAAYMVYALNSITQRTYSMPVQYHVISQSGDVNIYDNVSSPYLLYATQPARVNRSFFDFISPLKSDYTPLLSREFFRIGQVQPFTLNYFDGESAQLALTKQAGSGRIAFRYDGPYSFITRRLKIWDDPQPSNSRQRLKFALNSPGWGVAKDTQAVKRLEANTPFINQPLPKFDLFAYDVLDRQLFKSSWDREFYYGHTYYSNLTDNPDTLLQIINNREKSIED